MEVATSCLESVGGRQQQHHHQHHHDTVTRSSRWRYKLALLLKKPSSEKSSSRKKSSRPTQPEVEQWAQSLEKLLTHPSGVAAFQMFSKSEFCEENIEFWLACEDFRKTKTSETLALKAKHIYEAFVRKDSAKEVNLDCHTRERIGRCLAWPTGTCFEEAQRRIYYLMENNIYPRFLQSDFYRGLGAPEGL